jgi:hypothetical protein
LIGNQGYNDNCHENTRNQREDQFRCFRHAC